MTEVIERTVAELNVDRSDWQLVNFGDVAIQQKQNVDRENTDLTRYVKGEHMYSEDIHLREWGELKDEYLGPAFIRKFEEGDILYGSRRTYLRKVVIAPFEGITSNTTFVVKANEEKIDKRLLPFIMLSEGFSQHSIKNSKGSVNPYVNWKDLAGYEFLLPFKKTQANIIELLESIDDSIQKDKAILKNIEYTKASIFNELHKHRYERSLTLEDLCQKISSGGTPNRSKEDEYFNGEINWVKTKELNDWIISNTEEKITKEGLNNSSAKLYPANTILLAMYGVTVGKIGIIQKDMACNQACCAIIVDDNKIEYWFLFYYLIALRSRLIALSVGSAQPNISSGIIKNLKIPDLTIDIQKEYSRKLRNLDETKYAVVNKIESSKRLFNSLINKVF